MSGPVTADGLIAAPDGHLRCWWALSAPDYLAYHDEEWGRPVLDDDRLFERLCLEAFQSGLSWLTILRKRNAFRAAFADFRIAAVARFGSEEVERLLCDEGIVRNRRKIDAAIHNAGRMLEVIDECGSFAAFLWTFKPAEHATPRSASGIPTVTRESEALAKELRRRDFRFIGPTTLYALMQSCGLVNDHVAGCRVRDEVQREQVAAAQAPTAG